MEYLWEDVREVLVHQTKIGYVFLQETDSALLDDDSDDIIQTADVAEWLDRHLK
jgi:hypothetical protein